MLVLPFMIMVPFTPGGIVVDGGVVRVGDEVPFVLTGGFGVILELTARGSVMVTGKR